MKTITLIAISLGLLSVGAVQTPKTSVRQPATGSASGDTDKMVQRWEAREKAVRGALRISQPDQRILALKKLLVDYAEDEEIPQIVDLGILDTFVKYWPRQTAKIQDQLDRTLTRIPANFTTGSGNSLYSQIASKLVEAGILLDRAEDLARKGLAAFDEAKFIQAQKNRAQMQTRWIARDKNVTAVLKTDPITDAEMARMVSAERAKAQTTLGRVLLRAGMRAEAERILREAHLANPDIDDANVALAEIAAGNGEHAAVVNYLSSVAVRMPLRSELRRQLETAYRQTHNGSLSGLEEMLDVKYRDLMPNPIKVEPYKPTAARTERIVVAEVFTGAGCVPCVGADLAFEAATQRYSKALVLLMYHLHRPLPDPMVSPAALLRSKFYAIERTPGFAIDGATDTNGGALREKARLVYDRVEPVIEKRLDVPAEAEITLNAYRTGSDVVVRAKAGTNMTSPQNLRLQIALVEDEVRYSGENLMRIHPMVVRSLAKAGAGFEVTPGRPTQVLHTFNLEKISEELRSYLDTYEVHGDYGPISFREKKYKVDPGNVSIVAFVQDTVSKKILQSAYVKVHLQSGD